MNSEQIIQQAANWLTRLHDEDVTDADRQAFNTWCEATRAMPWPSTVCVRYGAASTACPHNRRAAP